MIIDGHGHVGIEKDFEDFELSTKDRMSLTQRNLCVWPPEVHRADDDSIVEDPRKTLWDEELWGSWKGMYDVNLRVEGNRYVWEKDGVKYYGKKWEDNQQPNDVITLMDKVGVDMMVNQSVGDNKYSAWLLDKYPDRFIGLCKVDESSASTDKELEKLRMYVNWGLKGIYFEGLPGWEGYYDNFHTEKFDPFWKEVSSLGILTYVVCEESNFDMLIRNTSKILRRFPELKIVIVHGLRSRKIVDKNEEIKVPKNVLDLINNNDVYVELLTGLVGAFEATEKVIKYLYHAVGSSKLVWGSEFADDYGIWFSSAAKYASQLGYLEKCDFLSKKDVDLIRGGNYQRIFKINFSHTSKS